MIIPVGFAAISCPLTFSGFPRPAFITFGVQNVAVFSDPNAVASGVQNALNTTIATRLDNEVVLGPTIARVNVSSGPIEGVADSQVNGSNTQTSPPPNVALLVKKITLTPGRHGRGRMYLPWAVDTTGVSQTGAVDPTVVDATTTAFTDLLNELNSGDLPMVLLHNDTTAPSEVVDGRCEPLVATQRRRLDR